VDGIAVLVVAAAIFLWGAVSARLARADLTAPIVFVALGAALAGSGVLGEGVSAEAVLPLVELTLVWVLFSDAARVPLRDLRADTGRCVRLLGVGLPLSIAAGWALALVLLPGLGGWSALLVAAALAPTDAALGVPVVTDPAVPAGIRRLISVESGLNDGIATPVVLLAIAEAASAHGGGESPGLAVALGELLVGAVIGTAAGAGGGLVLRWARSRQWAAEDFVGIAVLALALSAYGLALAGHGNGFVAAFCAGLGFGATAGPRSAAELVFAEQTAALVSLLVWLAFGAVAVPVVAEGVDVSVLLYAALSLTVVRMVPVAVACVGAGLDRPTVLFIGWFGPRGLASLVFALLALEELGPAADEAVAVIGVAVLASVVAHGITSAPLAARYGRWAAERVGEPTVPGPELAQRGLPRRRSAAGKKPSNGR